MHDPSDLPCPCHVSHLAIASSFLQHGNIAFTVKWRQSGFLPLVLLTNPKLQNQNYIGIGLPLSMVFHLYLNQNHIWMYQRCFEQKCQRLTHDFGPNSEELLSKGGFMQNWKFAQPSEDEVQNQNCMGHKISENMILGVISMSLVFWSFQKFCSIPKKTGNICHPNLWQCRQSEEIEND